MVVGIPLAADAVEDFMFFVLYNSIDINFRSLGKIPDLANHFSSNRSIQFKNDSLGRDN